MKADSTNNDTRKAPDTSGETGYILVMAIVISAVVGVISMALTQRVGNQMKAVASDLRAKERDSIVEFVQTRLDCRRTIQSVDSTYSASKTCPSGTVINDFYFYGSSKAQKSTAGKGTLLSNSTGVNSGTAKWYGQLSCEKTSLKLTMKLWDATGKRYLTDFLTGEVLDGSGKMSLGAGDASANKLCQQWFGGEPDSRIFSMGMTTLQGYGSKFNTDGSPLVMQYRCDGSLGEMVDHYFDNSKCVGASTKARTGFCRNIIGGNLDGACKIHGGYDYNNFTKLNDLNNFLTSKGKPTVNRACALPIYGTYAGNAECNEFCQAAPRHYRVGMLSRCDKTAGTDLDPIVPDSTGSQAVCYCMR